MFDLIFAVVAFVAAANPPAGAPQIAGGAGSTAGAAQSALVAEPQTPGGRFTTATEVKPILTATKANWVAVRAYGGHDLLYLTHLWSWRCGLAAVFISVNDGPMAQVALPECHMETAAPNAILEQDGLPYLSYPEGSIARVSVEVIYDDLSRDSISVGRGEVLTP